jgi:hypothetical protein
LDYVMRSLINYHVVENIQAGFFGPPNLNYSRIS